MLTNYKSAKRAFECPVCDFHADTLKGLEIHISKNASKEVQRGKTEEENLMDFLQRRNPYLEQAHI